MKIVTSGNKYIDIDAYAGCISYSYLLNLKGIQSKAVSTAKLNESITEKLLELGIKLNKYKPTEEDEFIIIDVSDKNFFDNIVKENKITEVIDHHTGFEDYWKQRLGNNSKIEFIGSVVTIIFELYEKENLQDKITKDIAYLMMSAILDNTLNFKAKVTNHRDIIAYQKLEKIVEDSENYASKYFLECQEIIERDLRKALENDTKTGILSKKLPNVFSQLAVWNKNNILDNKKLIFDTLNNFGNEWILNLICLEEGKSYIIASNDLVLQDIKKLLNGNINQYYLKCEDVWLRKEIINTPEFIEGKILKNFLEQINKIND